MQLFPLCLWQASRDFLKGKGLQKDVKDQGAMYCLDSTKDEEQL